jgi:hypothetical protein
MFGSQVLDIAIGMVFVYLTLSLLCSGLTEWLAALVGWALIALAVSQGAPFWFDLLNKLVNLRSTGQRPTVPQPTERRETQVVIQATPTHSNGQPVAQAAVYSAASAGD